MFFEGRNYALRHCRGKIQNMVVLLNIIAKIKDFFFLSSFLLFMIINFLFGLLSFRSSNLLLLCTAREAGSVEVFYASDFYFSLKLLPDEWKVLATRRQQKFFWDVQLRSLYDFTMAFTIDRSWTSNRPLVSVKLDKNRGSSSPFLISFR